MPGFGPRFKRVMEGVKNTMDRESRKKAAKEAAMEAKKVKVQDETDMLDVQGAKDGGRMGLKHGSYKTVPPSKGFSEYVTKEKQKKIDAANKKANEKDKPGGFGPMGRKASTREKDIFTGSKPIIIDLSKTKDGSSIFKIVESKAKGGRAGYKGGKSVKKKGGCAIKGKSPILR